MSEQNITYYLIAYTDAEKQRKVLVNVSPSTSSEEDAITKNCQCLVIKEDADKDQVRQQFKAFPNVKFAGVLIDEGTQAIACDLGTVEDEATLAGLLATESGWEDDGPNSTMDFQAFWRDATTFLVTLASSP